MSRFSFLSLSRKQNLFIDISFSYYQTYSNTVGLKVIKKSIICLDKGINGSLSYKNSVCQYTALEVKKEIISKECRSV